MPTATFVLTTLATAALIGGALTAYLWLVRRDKLKVAGGIATLAAMRWREFSHFVIEALQAQGFEAGSETTAAERGHQPALTLTRDNRTWLLSCKQGANYHISAGQVGELADAVRFEGAAGGILATLGGFQQDARKHDRGMELIDGTTLWSLIGPLLPPSVHRNLDQRAHQDAVRNTAVAWVVAVAVGALTATALGGDAGPPGTQVPPRETAQAPAESMPPPSPAPAADDQALAPAPASTAATATAATADDAAPPIAGMSENEQRRAITREIKTFPGIADASWSTRSTLLINLMQDGVGQAMDDICDTLARYPDLHTSRLQLQPPDGSSAAVRFRQCRAF